MPNAVDQFSSFMAQYRTQPAAPAQAPVQAPVQPAAGNNTAYNPYASTYVPAANRPATQPVNPTPWNNPNYPSQPGNPNQPVYPTQTGGTPQPVYPTQAGGQPTTTVYPGQPGYPAGYQGPVTMTLQSLKGVVNDKGYNKFVDQTAPVIDSALPLVAQIVNLINHKDQPNTPGQLPAQTPTQTPYGTTSYPQPGYPQPGYQQPGYATPTYTAQGQPAQGDWSAQVNQGIQGVAGLVNVIGGLFKN